MTVSAKQFLSSQKASSAVIYKKHKKHYIQLPVIYKYSIYITFHEHILFCSVKISQQLAVKILMYVFDALLRIYQNLPNQFHTTIELYTQE